jgi:predicted dehydrogenase
MPRRPSRRGFLAATAGAFAAPHFVRALGTNDRLNVAVIGCGGRGADNLKEVGTETIVALCDVDRRAIAKAAETHPGARRTTDFRRLFDRANEFDAVVVSTCEHTHAFATLPALQLGKHVYCEKPLTHGLWEARVIREAAAKAKVATQMGTQLHASDNFRRVFELVRTGAIGDVREVHVWVSRAWGLQSPDEARRFEDHKEFDQQIKTLTGRPTETAAVPDYLDWDLWIGPAPMRPFHPVYVPGPKWYRWWDFGSGTMSDLGSHYNDLPFWVLNLSAPTTIEAFGPDVESGGSSAGRQPPRAHPELAPASMSVRYEFPARPAGPSNGPVPTPAMPAVTMNWYQGTSKPDLFKQGKIPTPKNGVLFVGDKGMLLSEYAKLTLLPEKQFADYRRPEPFLAKSLGHHAEWIHAAKTGAPTTCHFAYAGLLTETNHLGNIAYRVGKKLEWDAAAMKATNCPAADPLIRREYRTGWTLA